MTNLLTRLNALRVANNMKPLKSWKASNAKLNEAIAALEPKRTTSPFADICREYDVNPKVGRALYRRHIGPVADFNADDADDVRAAHELLAQSAQRKVA